MPSRPESALEILAREIRICQKCPLHQIRQRAVPGEGDPIIPVMLVGEAPGGDEDLTGRPFVGQAGGLLTEVLGENGLERSDVYITNAGRCCPPLAGKTRKPSPDVIRTCRPYLDREIEILKPRIIVTLGATPLGVFLPNEQVSSAHGRVYWIDGRWIMASYHPSWVLRKGRTPQARTILSQDFQRLRHLITVDDRTQSRPWTLGTLSLLMASIPFHEPTVKDGIATWDTEGLHPMFQTRSAITELMRRATSCLIERTDNRIGGVITGVAVPEEFRLLPESGSEAAAGGGAS